MKTLNETLLSLLPLQKELKRIMSDQHCSVSKMPFYANKYECGQVSLVGKSGVVTMSSMLNTYFDASVVAFVSVAEQCLSIIKLIQCEEDELYSYLKRGLSTDNISIPVFNLRDPSIDEKSYTGFDYISESLNFMKLDTEKSDIDNLVTLSVIFKCFTLLMDCDRPYLNRCIRLVNESSRAGEDAVGFSELTRHEPELIAIMQGFIGIIEKDKILDL